MPQISEPSPAAGSDVTTLPLVDVIIPLYGIGPVFADTLLSVLNQQSKTFRLRCTVVVDGCRFMDSTYDMLAEIGMIAGDALHVIFQKNAGVVDARNQGIDHILNLPERADYVLFFDGDDILAPNYIDASLATLRQAQARQSGDQNIGWVYADQLHFGDVTHWAQYPTKMWGARFTLNNFSQPSCLMDIRLLTEAGLRFDPVFNLGIEDWDFWCAAVGKGYIGAHCNRTYVNYRRLLGSRSSSNRINDGLTKSYLTKKHSLDSKQTILQAADTFPRLGVLSQQETADQVADLLGVPPSAVYGADGDWARVLRTMASRYRYQTGPGILDAPHVPDIMILGAPEQPDVRKAAGLAYLAENILYNTPDLAFVEVSDRAGGGQDAYLVVMLSRLYNKRGVLIGDPKGLRMRLRYSQIQERRVAPFSDIRQLLTKRTQDALDKMLAEAPRRFQKPAGHIHRNVIGTHVASHQNFFDAALGFVPAQVPEPEEPLPIDETGSGPVGFIIPGRGGEDLPELIAQVWAELPENTAACLYLVGPVADPEFCKDVLDAHPWQQCFYINDTLFPEKRAASRSYFGVDLEDGKVVASSVFAGALSLCSMHYCFGVVRAAQALTILKSTQSPNNIYVANPSVDHTREFEHLAAFTGLYSEFRATDDLWCIEARARGVRLTDAKVLDV